VLEPLGPGSTLGRFRIEAVLGSGAFGAVYRARDPLVGEDVALKVLRPELAKDTVQMERFRREVLLARRVSHPSVCRLHDLQKDGEQLFLVMELVEGETLMAILQRERQLPATRAVAIVAGVCRGLAAAHAEGVLHRDIKPGNIMVRDNDAVSLLDFGVATRSGLDGLTRPGVALGTVGFLAPEVWDGAAASAASDVFAVGVVLYGCLCGRMPWRGVGLAVRQQMRQVPAAPPSVYVPALPPALDEVVLRAIDTDPARRFASAAALLNALMALPASSLGAAPGAVVDAAAADGAVGSAAPPAPLADTVPTRRSLALPVAAAAAAVLVAVGAWALWPRAAVGGAQDAAPDDDTVSTAADDNAARAHNRGAPDAALVLGGASEPAERATPAADGDDVATVQTTPRSETARVVHRVVERVVERAADSDARAAQRQRSELVREVQRVMQRRGIVAGDVPSLDAALRGEARKDATALRAAAEQAAVVAIDRAFVERKLQRLNARAGGREDPALRALSVEIAGDLSAGRFPQANARLNRALALVARAQ
jgi:hypothetical protein